MLSFFIETYADTASFITTAVTTVMPAQTLFLICLFVFVGVFAGLLSGLFGIGGGIILVPALFYLFETLGHPEISAMHLAVGTSLAISVPATLFSFRTHRLKKNVDMPLLKAWAPAILVGVIGGAYAGTLIEGRVLLKIFGVYLMIAALAMVRTTETKALFKGMPPQPWLSFIGVVIGGLSSLLGIGGGTITVPKMALFGKPMKQAVGTAAAISSLICFSGAISHIISGLIETFHIPYTLGYVHIIAFVVIAPLGMAAAFIGARLNERINAQKLRTAFGLFLLFVAGRMIMDAFGLTL